MNMFDAFVGSDDPWNMETEVLTFGIYQDFIWLVLDLPLWKIWKSVGICWDSYPIYEMENNPAMFETTNQLIINHY